MLLSLNIPHAHACMLSIHKNSMHFMFYLLFNQTLLKLGDNDWVGWINVLPASTWRDNVLGGLLSGRIVSGDYIHGGG
jgi:hypothetical protein